MAKKRTARLNEQFRREIIDIVRNHTRDPRIGMVTVTDVVIATDLGSARVYVTALGTDEEKASTIAGLKAAAPFVRSELSRRLTIRTVPELRFQLDQTLEHAHRIEELLGTVREQTEAVDAAAAARAAADEDEDDDDNVV